MSISSSSSRASSPVARCSPSSDAAIAAVVSSVSASVKEMRLTRPRGKVYVAAMNMRGKWAKAPDGISSLNVTSAQKKSSIERRDFSPMTVHEGGYNGFACFENYYQAGKIYEGASRTRQLNWWRTQIMGRCRWPGSRNSDKSSKRVMYAAFPPDGTANAKKYDYIQARKQVYVPEYTQLVKDTQALRLWKDRVEAGVSVVVYDFDGPRDAANKNEPLCLPLTKDLLKEKLNDSVHPFGHGYIVASMLAGEDLMELCNEGGDSELEGANNTNSSIIIPRN